MLRDGVYLLFRYCVKQQLPTGNQLFWAFLIRAASTPDERMTRWKWKKCWRDGAISALAATLGANIQIPLSARKWGVTGKKVAPRITPMLRCTAVTSLHRTKARKPPTINEFAISLEERGGHAPEIYHGYHLNMRFIETWCIFNKSIKSERFHKLWYLWYQ